MSISLDYALLLLTPAWPLLLALALAVPALRKVAARLVVTAPLPALLASLWLTHDPELVLPWLLLGANFGLDDLSRGYLLFSALLWFSAGLLLPETGRLRFSGWFLITMAGNFLVLLAEDTPGFYLAYAIMSLASFGLIIHWQDRPAVRAAKVYLVFAILGEMILFAAILFVAHNAGTVDLDHIQDRIPQDLLMALLFLGFGIKAGVPLLHMALPPAYASAPLAAAVPMAGALFHLGLYGWSRFLPLGQIEVPLWAAIYAGAGALAIIYAVAVGLTQREPRPLLAYSSISQMGVMMLGIGAGLASPDTWPAIQAALLFYAFHHALAKGALFLGLGIDGWRRAGLWLPALALAGMPFTSGALAKLSLKTELYVLPEFWAAVSSWLLPLSSVGTALLMARFLYLAFKDQTPRERTANSGWWLLLAALLLLPWLWTLPVAWTDALWSATWPLLLATALAWLVYAGYARRVVKAIPHLPPGDILVLLEKWLKPMHIPQDTHAGHEKESDALLHPRETPAGIALPERIIARWRVAVLLLLTLVIAVYLLVQAH